MELSKKKKIEKNEIYEIVIEDMTEAGEGLGKIDGYPLFVKDAIVGDTIVAKVVKAKKNYGYGRLEKVLSPSEYRVASPCPVARQCGGCTIQALSYEKQLDLKYKKVKNCLERIGGFSKEEIEEKMEGIYGMGVPYHYRNKAQFPVGTDKEGKLIAGFYAGRTHNIIENTDCLIQNVKNKEILDIVLSYMEKNHVKPYDEKQHKGCVRHILTRVGYVTGEIMVCLIMNGSAKQLKKKEELVEELKKIEGMTSIVLNYNSEKTNRILGDECETIWGRDYIVDYIGEVEYQIGPLSFYQVNPQQTKRLYDKVMEYADLKGEEIVWDLYCGIGTISLFLAQKAKKVYGVEIVEGAIDDARKNAKRNGMNHTEFFVGKAEEIFPMQYEKSQEKADVVVVDPPRKGCDAVLLDTIMTMAPERVVYVSCDPGTLARDLRILCEDMYEIKRVAVYDQFCHSMHVETVALLTRKKDVERIDIEMAVDKEDVTEKATYQKIKEYVKEKYGLNVHTKYIAEVKRKHGLPMHEAPNKVEVPKKEYPACPEEKAEAIEDALSYFQLI